MDSSITLCCLLNTANSYGNTALHEACRIGNNATTHCLLQSGADINAVNHKGSSPLHTFCYGDQDNQKGRQAEWGVSGVYTVIYTLSVYNYLTPLLLVLCIECS